MNFLETDYLLQLSEKSRNSINQRLNFDSHNFSDFAFINLFLINKVLYKHENSLLITLPDKAEITQFFLPAILLASIRCLNINFKANHQLQIGDVIFHKETGKILTVKANIEDRWQVLPLGTYKRIELLNEKEYISIASKHQTKIEAIRTKPKSIKTTERKLLECFNFYKSIFSYFTLKKVSLSIKHSIKVVIVASKSELINQIPDCIPYQYINKNGEATSNTMLEPLLTIVNDFKTIKECLIEKDIIVDTIVFIGDNKFEQSIISAIKKSYRRKEFTHAIFLGTQDIETGEEFNIYKWNWTLPEVKFFNQELYQNVSWEVIQATELSIEIKKFKDLINNFEQKFDNLISLKKLLPFINKLYPITALHNEIRIRERANETFENFLQKAEYTFQDEYLKIDEDYENDFEKLKSIYETILNLIKADNKKADWFTSTKYVDFIVVPNRIKQIWEKELKSCSFKQNNENKAKKFEDIIELFTQKQSGLSQYKWLAKVEIISVSEFFKRKKDDNIYLFLSLYGNGIYPDILLQRLLLSNKNIQILCYEEESMVLKYFLQEFQRSDNLELRSKQREELCGLQYPEISIITNQNVDDWLKYAIEFDEQKFNKRDEIKYHIYFDEEFNPFIERASKMIYVEDQEENFKEVRELSKGDKVRIYRPPSNELLHELIEMTDESNFFERVNRYSRQWKNLLKEYYQSKFFNYDFKALHNELQENRLSVDEVTLRKWLETDTKTRFPKRRIDIAAILKTIGRTNLINEFLKIMNEYYGELPKRGNQLRDEVDNYIITGEIGKMLNCLGKGEIDQLVNKYAPLRIVKEIKKIDEFID